MKIQLLRRFFKVVILLLFLGKSPSTLKQWLLEWNLGPVALVSLLLLKIQILNQKFRVRNQSSWNLTSFYINACYSISTIENCRPGLFDRRQVDVPRYMKIGSGHNRWRRERLLTETDLGLGKNKEMYKER